MSNSTQTMKTLVEMISFISENGIYSMDYVHEYAKACAPEWEEVLADKQHLRTIKNLLDTNYRNPEKRYKAAPKIPGKE